MLVTIILIISLTLAITIIVGIVNVTSGGSSGSDKQEGERIKAAEFKSNGATCDTCTYPKIFDNAQQREWHCTATKGWMRKIYGCCDNYRSS
ncbi:MAG: hypothetical protein FWC89_11470 [Defluviitaleaceae bacterium]|nr:hypothetical protein [Defluviitaleaceae bacterium]